MYKLMLFACRKPGLTRKDFREHYEAWHAPWGARRFFGNYVTRYVRNHVERVEFAPMSSMPSAKDRDEVFPYDVVTEFWFESEKSLSEWQEWKLDHPDGHLLTADEHSFFDLANTICVFVEEVEEIRDEPAERPDSSPPLEI